MRVFEILKGEIQGFEVPSELYGTTMTGAIALEDAIVMGFVATGDGVDYVFTGEELEQLKTLQWALKLPPYRAMEE